MRPRGGIANRYGPALLLLTVALVYSIAAPEGEWQRLVSMLLQWAALYATLKAAEVDGRLLRVFAVILVVSFAGALAQAGLTEVDDAAYVWVTVLVVLLVSLPLVAAGLVRQVRNEGRVGLQTMVGALSAYLLLIAAFSYGFGVISQFHDEPFFSEGAKWDTLGDYFYFSMITITTVGFGDLTPGTDLGRAVAAGEALIGQIYVVTVVAAIVSNLGRTEAPGGAVDRGAPEGEGPAGEAGGGRDATRG